ncbi:MAG: hypothetical protein JSV49_05625 [Thermoplasmata archaeon]|nr:MAG: hypothetical protein JSV49_05625 [Thermoplasmata archaeon]
MEFGRDAAIRVLHEKAILRADETIIWADSPQEDAYKFTTIVMALAVIIVIWAMTFWIPLIPTPFNLQVCLIGQVIILGISVGLASLTFYFRNHENRKESNAITNQRVLHYYHSAWGWTQNIDDLYHEQVIDVDMKKDGYIAKTYDVGNLFFRSRGGVTTAAGNVSAVSFTLISNPKEKHEWFRNLIIKEMGGGALVKPTPTPDRRQPRGAPSLEDQSEMVKELKDIKQILTRIEKKL